MKLQDAIFARLTLPTANLLLLGVLALSQGCVTLEKPPTVDECAKAGTCSDDPKPKDAAADRSVAPDLRTSDEPAGGKNDLGQDVASDGADASTDSLDSRNPDVAADTADATDPVRDVITGPDLFETRPDVGWDDVVSDDTAKGDTTEEDSAKYDASTQDLFQEDLAQEDVAKLDVPPEGPRDLGQPDLSYTACPAINPIVGQGVDVNTTSPVCFVTCDNIRYGWGCNFTETDRSVKINGTTVKCGDSLPTKRQPGDYYYFEIGAGGHVWDHIWWSGDAATSCAAPAGGFVH
jgi:hypothetical protein